MFGDQFRYHPSQCAIADPAPGRWWATLAGLACLALTEPGALTEGHVWAIALAGGLVLPVSFFSLSLSSRYTHPSNVSLLMFLETVLGPIWIWAGTGIQPTPSMLAGGVIVIVSLAFSLWHTGRR
ncbi:MULTISPECIES: hypothetical protein [Thioclava]|uniref:hypothetical protein n=1 Tax=Thioclava TaxID=285107 RepID=UPI001F0B3140|nr:MULTISPECIES: hypothetical protein [Thioclava]